MMKKKIDSLKTLHNIISRLERNSFANKGWLVVLISTLVTVSYSQPLLHNSWWSFLLFTAVIILFWFCDSYYKGLAQHYRELANELAADLEKNTSHVDFLLKIKRVKYWTQYKLAGKNMLKGDVGPFYISLLVVMALFVSSTPPCNRTSKSVLVDSAYVSQQIDSLKLFMTDSIITKIEAQTEITSSIGDPLNIMLSASRKPKAKLPACEKYVRMNSCQDTIVHKIDLE